MATTEASSPSPPASTTESPDLFTKERWFGQMQDVSTRQAEDPPSASTASSLFNEERWLHQMRSLTGLDHEEKDADVGDAVHSIFDVPEPLRSSKPEAYTPRLFAIGPYHKLPDHLYKTEPQKAKTVRRDGGEIIKGLKFDLLLASFTALESNIRAYYHRYLDYQKDTLAMMMAIDACFVLMFLRKHYSGVKGGTGKDSPKLPWDKNAMLRDIMMLENQIPLCLVEEIVKEKHSDPPAEGAGFEDLLGTFITEVSPFKMTENLPLKLHHLLAFPEKHHHHLLAILYDVVTPKWIVRPQEPCRVKMECQDPDSTVVRMEYRIGYEDFIMSSGAGPIAHLLKSQPPRTEPFRLLQTMLTVSKQFTDKFGRRSKKPAAVPGVEGIPTATALAAVGVRFVATSNGIGGIHFDAETREFHLPVVFLDGNTEVIMWNLVAYEAVTAPARLIFARYTELMSRIVGDEEDVKLLRKREIIRGSLGNEEALALWKAMNRPVRDRPETKVPQLDREIRAVNEFCGKKWSVKARRLMGR